MVFHICFTNLKGFVITRPPLVIFTICLTALAIATLSLARVVNNSDSLPNPDVRLDWNLLLERVAGLDLCIVPEESTRSMLGNATSESDDETVTTLLGVAKEVHSTFHNNTVISGNVPASFLGLRGNRMITITLRIDVNATAGHPLSNICASFTGPRAILPLTRSPPTCPLQDSLPSHVSGKLVVRAEGPHMVDNWCEEGTLLKLSYHKNPSLSAMLTLHDRSVVNLHLMHTSYFLLVMAMTLVCYAILKGGKNAKQQGNPTVEKVPLEP